jgi:hypothetical protein
MTATAPSPATLVTLFDTQLEALVLKGYPALLGQTADAFRTKLEGLRPHIATLEPTDINLETGKLPFAIVVGVSPAEAFARLQYNGKPGVLSLYPASLEEFHTRPDVTIPEGEAYLLTGIDRGAATLNVTPETALETICSQGRSPLTVLEGIAVLTQYPQFLQKNNCFSLLASRRGDQRVPALWISGHQAKLGWCWDRNPHTWLGSASCAARVGI